MFDAAKHAAMFATDRFSRQSTSVESGLSNEPTERVTEALSAVYGAFKAPPPSAIEGCPCCIDTRGNDVLLTTPLRQISGQALWEYVLSAFLTVGDQRDFQYLLPRILEVSVSDPGHANDPQVVLSKLKLAEWRSWPADKQRVIEAFIDAWFEQALASHLSGPDEGWIGWDAESVICGAARAGLPLERFLSPLAEPSAAPLLADIRERFPRKPSGYWENVPSAFHEMRAFLDHESA